MQIKLKKLALQNFKGCKGRLIEFGDKTIILGANATGKTTIIDGFMWLLFDKDSSGISKFQIRPLDSAGNQIDSVEILVEGTLDIDGKETVLKKVQKQIWRKKRGTDTIEFQGNVNEFEIDGYPKSEKDYKEYISDIVDEELFKMVTSPAAFASLPWKKKREVLMKLINEISDIEIAQSDEKFLPLILELERASTNDIQKKYNKAMKEWKKKQVELPARIDEVSKQLVDIDVAELELQANYLREQIDDMERQQEDADSAVTEYDKVSAEIIRVKGKMRAIFDEANSSLLEERKSIQRRIDEAAEGFEKSRGQIKLSEMKIEQLKNAIEQNEAEKIRLLEKWEAEYKRVFPEYEELSVLDENSLVCPTCGQVLQEELRSQKIADYEERKKQHRIDYDKSREDFEESKENRKADINEKGKVIVAEIKKNKSEIERQETLMKQAKEDSIRFNKEKSASMEELAKLPKTADLSDNQEYEAFQTELSNLEESQRNMDSGADYRGQLKIKLSGLREELSAVEKKIASADNSAIEERLEQLKEEQRDVGQKVADQEKMIYLLEQFIREKMDKISESINSKFNTVSWKLFETQINGGMKECCECTVNGVPYSALNSGHRIIAGLDIINSLSQLYGVEAPIFIDNAEAISDGNLPNMDCQMILLKVADPIYEYEYEDKDGFIPKRDESGQPIISKVVYDGSLKVEESE